MTTNAQYNKERNQFSLNRNQSLKKCSSFIVQKYIESPLLINNRKFDIRIWVLITQDCQYYICKEGYIRTSSEKFMIDQESIQNPFIHLTNDAIQKNSNKYGQFESANKLSYQQFINYLKINNIKLEFSELLTKIKEIIILTLESISHKMFAYSKQTRQQNFEIFGYDFMIDSHFNPWLIEANINPCIDTSGVYLESLVPRMLNDMFKLTIDQFHQQFLEVDNKKWNLEGYSDNENIWEQVRIEGCQYTELRKQK